MNYKEGTGTENKQLINYGWFIGKPQTTKQV